MPTSYQVTSIEKIKKWILSGSGSHSYDSPLGICGIWVSPENGRISVREDCVDELIADESRLLDLLYESTRAGTKW